MSGNQGVKISDDQNSLKAGLRGPTLLEDFHLREKITHFDHERIPERVVLAVKGFAAPETGQAFSRARELWEQLGSPSEFFRIPLGQSRYHAHRGELNLALRLDEDLLRLSRQRDDSPGLILSHDSSGRNLFISGRFASSRSHLEEVLALYDPLSHRPLVHQAGFQPHVNSASYLGIVLFCLGFPNQAFARSNESIAEARRLAHPPSLASRLALCVVLLSLIGDNAALEQRIERKRRLH